ncbi:hypothetical protein H0H81_005403 [Sphagnurus paluster]|uniref:Uncharacterized protein n=1 Tax=Sphagnurus paluster TaxID=117069 RepID=A0A9P7KL54_9AGAR|nr:hypothetical protein H0H81_005403 [Sphagnurus paluster]
MNRRYRQVPTFGHSTIRRFSDNVASLKKLAARNYEDLLQCAIPVFDGLLNGDDNNTVVSLLFTLAEWHALGKLHLHTETSLLWLDQSGLEISNLERQRLVVVNFYTKLQDYLLGHLLHPDWSGGPNKFSEQERTEIHIVNDRFYRHKVMRVNYTGYNVQRGQDLINSRNHADIITLAPEGETYDNGDHPFQYSRVIRIFHVDFIHDIPGTRQIPISKQVLWMQWFQYDKSYCASFQRHRLHCIHFIPSHDPNAFGFLDPDEVVRGSHLIPAFHHGPTDEYLKGTSVAREEDELNDWKYFHVDRDMYMRYAGSGVGHYQVPLTDTPVVDSTSTTPITIELLWNLAEAAGSRIVGGDDYDANEEHRDELTLDKEDEGEAHIEGTVEIDEHDIGAEDGKDGAEEFDDQAGYADL